MQYELVVSYRPLAPIHGIYAGRTPVEQSSPGIRAGGARGDVASYNPLDLGGVWHSLGSSLGASLGVWAPQIEESGQAARSCDRDACRVVAERNYKRLDLRRRGAQNAQTSSQTAAQTVPNSSQI